MNHPEHIARVLDSHLVNPLDSFLMAAQPSL